MTPKQRLAAALAHEEPDRCPLDLWITPEVEAALKRERGIEDPFELRAALGHDLLMKIVGQVASFYMSEQAQYVDAWGILWRRVEFPGGQGSYTEMVGHPLAGEDALLLDRLRTAYVTIGCGALQVVADRQNRILGNKAVDRLLTEMLGKAGLRITDINETTRRTIADTLAEGVRRGYSIPQLTSGVADEAYGGVRGALMANGVNVWDDARAETIARSETMFAYNQSAIRGYSEFGVRQLEAIDGDFDPTCESRNGTVYSVDDALNVDEHPNGTLDWAPLSN